MRQEKRLLVRDLAKGQQVLIRVQLVRKSVVLVAEGGNLVHTIALHRRLALFVQMPHLHQNLLIFSKLLEQEQFQAFVGFKKNYVKKNRAAHLSLCQLFLIIIQFFLQSNQLSIIISNITIAMLEILIPRARTLKTFSLFYVLGTLQMNLLPNTANCSAQRNIYPKQYNQICCFIIKPLLIKEQKFSYTCAGRETNCCIVINKFLDNELNQICEIPNRWPKRVYDIYNSTCRIHYNIKAQQYQKPGEHANFNSSL